MTLQVLAPDQVSPLRVALAFDDPLLTWLGRTSREQVVMRRDAIATTLQALELTNGSTLADKLREGGTQWAERAWQGPRGPRPPPLPVCPRPGTDPARALGVA